MDILPLDGAQGEGGGQILRTALALSAVTGQAFRVDRIRASRLRPGLRPQHLAAVRAAAIACGAEVHGAFDGSPDLRFVPGAVTAGDFRFEIGTAGAATLVLQAVLPVLATAPSASRVTVTGGTHVPRSPSHHFLERHWAQVVGGLGLGVRLRLDRAGFFPRGGGCVEAEVGPWPRPAALDLSRRGALVAVRGIAGAARLRGDVARRAADAAQALLWEQRRIEAEWEVVDITAASPGAFVQVEAVFEAGRAAFGLLGERGLRAEVLGERAARRVLKFIEDEEAVVDPWLADQLAVPLAVAGGGGRLCTSEVTAHLETVAAVLCRFGVPAETWGRRGGPGGLSVGAIDLRPGRP
ncbi:MAG TPA: RNA 3'-terminal phosphate cyclase [Vicinamibacteria bacterium]|nr:RNA 3'-terminal phosphate cyclase [Vicinamibacteria bacterium]